MAYGVNRRFVNCGCGHPIAAHDPTCHCGCTGAGIGARRRGLNAAEIEAQLRSPRLAKQRERVAKKTRRPAPASTARDEFLSFVALRLTVHDQNRLLRKLAWWKGVSVDVGKEPIRELRRFTSLWLTDGEAQKFLRVLRARRKSGDQLIQGPTPPLDRAVEKRK
ncbi:MAG: hypothetical protein HOQ03_08660 [Thermoleophilia bacterium]|nr:hypothetical protein [Thermoleophilia bacterium]